MFTGKYIHTIDEKGRVVLPSTMRKQFEGSGTCIISPALDGQLAINLPHEYAAYLDRAEAKASTGMVRRRVRLLSNSAIEQSVDKAGRVVINEELRTTAGISLGSEVVVAGAHKHAEIWNPERFARDLELARIELAQEIANEGQPESNREVAGS